MPEQGQLFVNVENDGAFNKGATSHSDIFDVFRLTLKFSYFLFSKISAVESCERNICYRFQTTVL